MAQNRTRNRPPAKPAPKPAKPQVDAPPSWAQVTGPSLLGCAVGGTIWYGFPALYLPHGHVYGGTLAVTTTALAVGATAAARHRWFRRHARKVASQRIGEAAKCPPERVNLHRDGATVIPGAAFNQQDPAHVRALVDAVATWCAAPAAHVHVAPKRGGALRARYVAPAPVPPGPAAPADGAPGESAPPAPEQSAPATALARWKGRGEQMTLPVSATPAPSTVAGPTPVLPPEQEAHRAAHEAAVQAVLAGATLEVTEWRSDGWPKSIDVTYPATLAKQAATARPDLLSALTALREPEGMWAIQWDRSDRKFLITDVPDPLRPPVPLPPMPTVPFDLRQGVPLGITEDGEDFILRLAFTHTLLFGASGSGKGSVIRGIIRQLAPLVAAGLVRLWVIDPKGGMELREIEPICHRFTNGRPVHVEKLVERRGGESEVQHVAVPGALALLEEAVEAMGDDQASAMSSKFGEPTRENPWNIVVIDEVLALTALTSDSKQKNAMTQALATILTQGRAAGWSVFAATQESRVDGFDLRTLFLQRIILGVTESGHVDMFLGRGARAKGAYADLIPVDDNPDIGMPGTGYITADGKARVVRFRTGYTSDEELARLTEWVQDEKRRLRPIPAPAETRAVPPGVQDPLPAEPEHPGKPVRVRPGQLEVGQRFQFDGDPDVVTLTEPVTGHGDEPDRLLLTYRYDGETKDRTTDVDENDTVLRMPTLAA